MSDIVLAAIQETARRAQADLADARKVIAKLERERDEAESRLPSDVSWLFEQLLGTDLVDHEPYKEVLTKWRTDTTLRARIAQLESQIAMKDGALKKIEKWFGEFPPTDRFWDEDKGTKNEPMSYAACYGSNGERDFMRDVAREALKGSAK